MSAKKPQFVQLNNEQVDYLLNELKSKVKVGSINYCLGTGKLSKCYILQSRLNKEMINLDSFYQTFPNCSLKKDFGFEKVRIYKLVFWISRKGYYKNYKKHVISHRCGAPKSLCINPRDMSFESDRLNGFKII